MLEIVQGNEQTKSEVLISKNFSLMHLRSQQAVKRSFVKTQEALFKTEVIIPNMADQTVSDAIEKIISDLLENASADLKKENERLNKLFEDNGIENQASFSNPVTYRVDINSGYLNRYIALLEELDKLMCSIDVLRLHCVFDSQQTKQAQFLWRQRIIKMSTRIIGRAGHSLGQIYKQKNQLTSEQQAIAQKESDALLDIEDEELKQEVQAEVESLDTESSPDHSDQAA